MSSNSEEDHVSLGSEDAPDSVGAGTPEVFEDHSPVMDEAGPPSDEASECSEDESEDGNTVDLPTTISSGAGNKSETKEYGMLAAMFFFYFRFLTFVAGSYVPPHMRSREDQSNVEVSAEIVKLKRQLKGLLNRWASYASMDDARLNVHLSIVD